MNFARVNGAIVIPIIHNVSLRKLNTTCVWSVDRCAHMHTEELAMLSTKYTTTGAFGRLTFSLLFGSLCCTGPKHKCILFGCVALHFCLGTTYMFGCHFGHPGKNFSSLHSNMVPYHYITAHKELKHDHKRSTQLYTTNKVLSS
jgi:hypothetical protein